jgi:hypothetical protein
MIQPKPAANSVFRFALPVVAIAALLCLWAAWREFPRHSLNEARLAPAFALRYGINPYPPVGGGPLSTWIYGPVGIVLNLPATWANSAENALHLASLINFAVLILPLAVIFFSSRELSARDPAVRWFAVGLAALLIPRPNLVFQVADHAAIAFGLLSCWWLARPSRPQTMHLAIAAAFCALAISSKQIAVFLIAAQIAYLRLSGERAATRYLLWVALWGSFALGVSVWAFGWENIWLNLVAIPGRLPWADDLVAKLAIRRWPLIAQIVLPCLGLAILWYKKLWPDRGTESKRFFQLTVLAYLIMLPIGITGYLKIGGDTNLLHSWDYLFPGCLLVWLALTTENSSTRPWVRVLTATALAVALRASDLSSFQAKTYTEHFTVASTLTAIFPHAIWFPRNPIITFYADHELWHSEDGVQTRFLANYGLREPDFRRHLPPNLQAVAYPSEFDSPFSMPLLSELSHATKLPYWTIYTRPSEPTGKP